MLREWSNEFALDIDEIDEQHKGFFEASHRLYDEILNCAGEHAVEESVAFLRDYASKHFQTEEAFMCGHDYPRLEEHQKLHAQFFEALDQLVEDLEVFGPSQHLADRTLEIAQDWLIEHIADEDNLYAVYVRKQK